MHNYLPLEICYQTMAVVQVSSVNSELNKLTKQLLIDIIISGKVSCEVPKNINYKIIEDFLNEQRNNLCKLNNETHNLNYSSETDQQLKEISIHNEYLNKLNYHLEKRIGEQEQLMLLLKENISLAGNAKSKPPVTSTNTMSNSNSQENSYRQTNTSRQSTAAPSASIPKHSSVNKQKSDMSPKPKNNEFLRNKNKADDSTKTIHKQKVTGSNGTCNKIKIKTVSQQIYLSVSRLDPETKIDDLLEFLKSTAPHIPFKGSLVRSTIYQANFKLSVPTEYLEDVFNASLWPEGAMVQKFDFNRNKNFQRRPFYRRKI